MNVSIFLRQARNLMRYSYWKSGLRNGISTSSRLRYFVLQVAYHCYSEQSVLCLLLRCAFRNDRIHS